MDNFDFVAHLASTASALDTSAQVAEQFLRAYYQEMRAVMTRWYAQSLGNEQPFDQAFSDSNAVHQKFWLSGTRFTEYWQPAIESPENYVIADSGVTIFADMLGNFVAVVEANERTTVYLLAVVREELRIINKFFR